MPTNEKLYMRKYMANYTKTKGAELFNCQCGKDVKKCDRARHNKTKFHTNNVDKVKEERKASEIELLRQEIEALKKMMPKL